MSYPPDFVQIFWLPRVFWIVQIQKLDFLKSSNGFDTISQHLR